MVDELQILALRYGSHSADTAETARLEVRANRARFRRTVIENQLAELLAERDQVDDELRRLREFETLLRHDDADRIRRLRGEGWSPTPVVGFRAWFLDSDRGAVGATNHVWTSASQTATCANERRPLDDIPHTDHHCSSTGYGCGIYATKAAQKLDFDRTNCIYGAVLLSGKVAEHELG